LVINRCDKNQGNGSGFLYSTIETTANTIPLNPNLGSPLPSNPHFVLCFHSVQKVPTFKESTGS